MKQIVLRSPVVLYETVEALYQHVNGLSVEGRKRDLLQKFGSKLTRTEREQIEQSCTLAAKVAEAACTGLEDGPALETFFRKWETESKWQNTCLAKLMIFSFLDIRTTDLEQSLQRTRQSAEERLNGPYLLRHQLLRSRAGADDPAAVRAAGRPDDRGAVPLAAL